MPDIGNYSILPRFPGEVAEKGLDRLLPDKNGNWYSRWVTQIIGDLLFDNNYISELLKLVMAALVDSKLILEFKTRK